MAVASCGDVQINIGGDGDDVPGSGMLITEDRNIGDFDTLTLAGEGTVNVRLGPTSLSIRTDDNLMQHIETTVSGSTLRIATEDGIDIEPTESVVYDVTTPTLTGVVLSGAGTIDVPDWEADSFSITLSGAGTVDLDALRSPSIDVTLSGFGDVVLSGETSDLDVTLSGAGSFEGGWLQASDVRVVTSGAGSAIVWATATLEELATPLTAHSRRILADELKKSLTAPDEVKAIDALSETWQPPDDVALKVLGRLQAAIERQNGTPTA